MVNALLNRGVDNEARNEVRGTTHPVRSCCCATHPACGAARPLSGMAALARHVSVSFSLPPCSAPQEGLTALLVAARKAKDDILKALLAKGADTDAKDKARTRREFPPPLCLPTLKALSRPDPSRLSSASPTHSPI